MDKHILEINSDGFTVVEKVLEDKSLIEKLKVRLDESLEEDKSLYHGLPNKRNNLVLDLVVKGEPFLTVLANEKMHQIFERVLDPTCILYSSTSTLLFPNKEQESHQIHRDAKRSIPNYHFALIMILALDDFTPKSGATFFLPGSQNLKERPGEDYFFKNAKQIQCKAGDAVFFNPNVWHAAGNNNTDKTRYAMGVYAVRSFMRQKFDYPRMLSKSIIDRLSEKQRSFLGFNVQVPTSLYEYYVPEEKRLYKSNQG